MDIFYLSESLSHESALVLLFSPVLSDFSFEDGFGAKHMDGELPPIPGARVARPFCFWARATNLAIPGTPVFRGAWSAPAVND